MRGRRQIGGLPHLLYLMWHIERRTTHCVSCNIWWKAKLYRFEKKVSFTTKWSGALFYALIETSENIKRWINIPSNAPRKITRIFRWSRRRAHGSSFLSVRRKITYRSRMISNQTDPVHAQFSIFSSFLYIHSSELCFLILNSR